jgi:prefoldin subunit 5
MGLIVEFTQEEATAFIPKRLGLLNGRIARLEDEIVSIEELKNKFMQQFEMLQNVNSGMVNVGSQMA